MFNNVKRLFGSVLGFGRNTRQPVMVVSGFVPPTPKERKPLVERQVQTWALPVLHSPTPANGLTARIRRREAKALWHTDEMRRTRAENRVKSRVQAQVLRDMAGL